MFDNALYSLVYSCSLVATDAAFFSVYTDPQVLYSRSPGRQHDLEEKPEVWSQKTGLESGLCAVALISLCMK